MYAKTLDEMGIDSTYINERLDEIGTEIANTLGKAALPVLFSTFSIAVELLFYLVASFYFIVHGDRFVMAFRAVLNRKYHAEFDRLMVEINSTLGAYLRGQALLVLIMASASFAVLSVLGVKYALIIAIATGFLELIPLVGPWIAGAIAVAGIFVLRDDARYVYDGLTSDALPLVIASGLCGIGALVAIRRGARRGARHT